MIDFLNHLIPGYCNPVTNHHHHHTSACLNSNSNTVSRPSEKWKAPSIYWTASELYMLFGSLNHLGAYWHVFRMGLTWGFICTFRKKTKTISTNSSRSSIPPSSVLLVWSFFYAPGFYKADQCLGGNPF